MPIVDVMKILNPRIFLNLSQILAIRVSVWIVAISLLVFYLGKSSFQEFLIWILNLILHHDIDLRLFAVCISLVNKKGVWDESLIFLASDKCSSDPEEKKANYKPSN